MAKEALFTDDDATDLAYIYTRAADNERSRMHRENCEMLWDLYEPFADPEFRKELRSNFGARYWEMYLTVTLLELGHKVCCPKPGPDVGIELDGRRIWFEATSPDRGKNGTADQVPEQKFDGNAYDVPNEKMILRYLNSISAKRQQHASWLKNGHVKTDDAFIIAINPRGLGHEFGDAVPPRILQASFAVGNQYVVIDTSTMMQVDSGFQFRDSITKSSGSGVATGVFLRAEYAVLSGLLCSRVDVANQPPRMGDDFQLVPNPGANVGLPEKFRLPGTYFRVDLREDGYTATAETVDRQALSV
jgi:hypothetical protein